MVFLVVDTTVGITEEDAGHGPVPAPGADVPVLVVANKVDDVGAGGSVWEFVGLGLGDPHPVSALHGRGTGDLLDALVDLLPGSRGRARPGLGGRRAGRATRSSPSPWWAAPTWASRRCSTGSSARSAPSCTTCPAPPATPSTPSWRPPTGPIRFVDTAGMRRKSRIDEGTEYFSLRPGPAGRRRRRRGRCSSSTPPRASPTRTSAWPSASTSPAARSSSCSTSGSCSTPSERTDVDLPDRASKLGFIGESVVLKVSALTGKGVHRLLPALAGAIEAYHRRVPTRKVNDVHPPPPSSSSRRPTAAGSSTPPRARSTRRPSPSSPTRSCPRPTCATSSAACGRRSTWGRHRSSCGCGGGADGGGPHAPPARFRLRRVMRRPLRCRFVTACSPIRHAAPLASPDDRARSGRGGRRLLRGRAGLGSLRPPLEQGVAARRAPVRPGRRCDAAGPHRRSARSCTPPSSTACCACRPAWARSGDNTRPLFASLVLVPVAVSIVYGRDFARTLAHRRGPLHPRAPGRGGAEPGGAGAPALGRPAGSRGAARHHRLRGRPGLPGRHRR